LNFKREKPEARCVAVFGTGSDVGKSIVVTALCRIFSDLGVSVAPFKAQNMSNNSCVTPEGGEMGRAQIVQAEAARIVPHVDMNPVLLKPCTDTGAQVVLYGKPRANCEARDYFSDTKDLFEKSLVSLKRLREAYSLIIMEGAGSCAEVNLRSRDFVNFPMAHAADAPVILVADIDRGGVFAQIIGTLELISPEDRQRVEGVIINRFRGDSSLFEKGIEFIEKKTGIPVLGLIPYFQQIQIDSEDGVPLDALIDPPSGIEPGRINIGVIRLPHISNFTDFNPFELDASTSLHYLTRPRRLDGYDAIFIPGSKNVRFDMEWLRNTGWADNLTEFVHSGGRLAGICGGYQMLGKLIRDPYGIEGMPGETKCLGFLDVETTLRAEKILSRSTGVWESNGEGLEGYEIHMGVTECGSMVLPLIRIITQSGVPADKFDGAVSFDGKIWGTYFHGLFDTPSFRQFFLTGIRADYRADEADRNAGGTFEFKNQQYDLLAKHFQVHLDMNNLFKITGFNPKTGMLKENNELRINKLKGVMA
jgi:adenosylcobyric acid synthase